MGTDATFTANPASPQSHGAQVVIMGQGTGGTGSYESLLRLRALNVADDEGLFIIAFLDVGHDERGGRHIHGGTPRPERRERRGF